MAKVFLLLGSNIGNKKKYIDISIFFINKYIGDIYIKSSYYISQPWKINNLKFFINIVILINTIYSPIEILNKIHYIENIMGRKKKNNIFYQNRIIDIDILFYDNIIYKSKILSIPHYLLHTRNFVLYPLCEISPNKKHPYFNKSLLECLYYCNDKLKVKIL